MRNSPLRILHVNKFVYRRAGAEVYMFDTAHSQVERGHVVDFFGMKYSENEPSTYAEYFAPEMSLNPPPETRKGQVSVGANMVWNRRAAAGMAAVVAAFRPDVAHLHNVYHQLSPSIVRELARHDVPTVMTLHDYKLTCPTYNALRDGAPCFDCAGGRTFNALRHRCAGSAPQSALLAVESGLHRITGAYGGVDFFHCPSRFLLDKMAASGVYPDRLRHVPLHIDSIRPAPADGIGDHALFIGRLAAEKGVDVIIRAIARCPGRQLVVVGDGPDRASLEALAADIAPGQVRFEGWVPRAEVSSFIEAARFAVVASIWWENQPLTVLESHGVGRAVVGSDLGGVAELIEDGVTGLLAAPGDVGAFAAAMNRLFDDRDLAVDLGQRGWKRVNEEASVEVHLGRLHELYGEAMAKHGQDGARRGD